MDEPKQSDHYSDEEAARRMNEALKRALNMPHKPQSAYKVGKRKKRTARNPKPK